ncbi:MAG: hypothetical protein PHV82_16960, partial [Victivallaceae bacterium]|nr:hypothetical protein [Victivallaceae bacterium]
NDCQLTHSNGVSVAYEDGSAEFITIPNPLLMNIVGSKADVFNRFFYLLRKNNPNKPYNI